MLAVATIGFAATFWLWTMLASLVPELTHGFALDPLPLGLLVGVPLAIGALGRFPVGVLTDHYGARLVLPAVAVVAAVPLVVAALVAQVPALVAVVLASAVGGTTFAAGAALVCRHFPPVRRGLALGVFGTGMAGAAVAVLTSPYLDYPHEYRTAFLLAAAVLIVFAGTAAAVVRDRPSLRVARSIRRAAVVALRTPTLPRLAALYAMAFGTLIAIAMYLPGYLRIQYQMSWDQAMLLTAAFIAAAAALRPIGGALADRDATASALGTGFALTGVCLLAQAFAPPLPVATIVFGGMAIGLGTTSGALLGLIGITTPPERVGAVAGAVGTAGGLGGLVPPLLLAGVHALNGSFAIGITMLSALLLVAASIRTDGLTSAEREELALLRTENRKLRKDMETFKRAA